jgi:serine/threonine protein kinase
MSENRRIGKYQITGLIGTGGQGQVHSAIDNDLGREVAIKSLHHSESADAAGVNRFRSEAKSLARIIHSNIATLIDFFPLDDHLYMIMELVHGRTLEDILRERGEGLGVRECLAIVAQAADGLAYAHETGVIHRDVKPSNLMITASGRVKIMDFGIARVRGSDRLTRVGTAVGTPLYMSPEQCMGSDGDERSDIYSLAIVLYELLAGAPPFEGKTDHQLAEAHIKSSPSPLIPRIAGVTPAIESAVMKALSKKPEQRFVSMRAFSVALGANALLADATDIVKGHANLAQKSTSAGDAALRPPLPSIVMATIKSRAATLVRHFNALHPAAKGAGVGLMGAVVLATIMLWPSPSPKVDPGIDTARIEKGKSSGASAPPADQRTASGGQAGHIEAIQLKTPCVPNGTFAPGYSGCDSSAPMRVQSDTTSPADPERAHPDTMHPQIARAEPPSVKSPVSEPGIVELRKAFDAQNYGEAYPLARRLAKFESNGEGGDKGAQYVLGYLFSNGLGGAPRDVPQALRWLERAALQGESNAQVEMGMASLASRNGDQARNWFEKAASQGNGVAQFQIGRMIWLRRVSRRGEGDCDGLPWFLKSAEQHVAGAQYALGFLHEKGFCGLVRDAEEASRFYRMAAEQGQEEAKAALQKMGRM